MIGAWAVLSWTMQWNYGKIIIKQVFVGNCSLHGVLQKLRQPRDAAATDEQGRNRNGKHSEIGI